MSVTSRRFSTRRSVRVACQAVRERDFRLVASSTLDLSPDGVLLAVDRPVLTGEGLIVSFQLAGTWIDAEAIVTRVVHGRRPGDEGMAVGASFEGLSAASRAVLAGHLHRRPLASPKARAAASSVEPAAVDARGVLFALVRAFQGLADEGPLATVSG